MKKYNSISEISSADKYEGYVWMSDQQKPIVLQDEAFDFSKIKDNPFVIEALLYCKEKNVSIMVKHTDKYIINEYDLTELAEKSEITENEYLPHRVDGVSKLKFATIWRAEKDPLCENMESLKLKANVFTGFNFKN